MQINNVSLVGRVGKDPEIKYFESGKCLANFSIAVNRTKDITDWFDLVAWDKTAETVGKYVTKGKQVAVTATLYHDVWEDKGDGKPRSKPIFRVERLTLLGKGADGEGGSSAPPPAPDYDLDDF